MTVLTSVSRERPQILEGLGVQTHSLGRHFGSPHLPQASGGPWLSVPDRQMSQALVAITSP